MSAAVTGRLPEEEKPPAGPHNELFALRARRARPGLQQALAVLLGVDYDGKAGYLLELCEGKLENLPPLLQRAGCEVRPEDSLTVELLYAAASSRHGKTSCKVAPHTRLKKPGIQQLLDTDPMWRRDAKTRDITSPQPSSRMQQSGTGRHIIETATPRSKLAASYSFYYHHRENDFTISRGLPVVAKERGYSVPSRKPVRIPMTSEHFRNDYTGMSLPEHETGSSRRGWGRPDQTAPPAWPSEKLTLSL